MGGVTMKRVIQVILSVIVLIMLNACGGGGSSDSGTTPTPTPPDTSTFEKVSEDLNAKNVALTFTAKSFAEDYNALMAFDPTGVSGEALLAPFDKVIASTESMLKDLEDYQSLLTQYHEYTSTTKSVDLRQGTVDPFFVLSLGEFLDETVATKKDLKDQEESGDYTQEEMAVKTTNATTKLMNDNVAFGITATFGTLMGTFAGLAASTAGAPVLVTLGTAVLVGTAAGAFLSWCASPDSKMLTTKAQGQQICAMATVTSEIVKLPNGENGFTFMLPAGEGTLCLHFEGKAPVCIDEKIINAGNTISIDCLADKDDPSMTKECNDGVVNEEEIAIIGENCSTDVYSVSATPTSVGISGATVSVKTVLPTEGCHVEYSLVGTDGYIQSGTLVTDSAGGASFHVPAGKDGVYDSVTATVTESGASTHAGYTF